MRTSRHIKRAAGVVLAVASAVGGFASSATAAAPLGDVTQPFTLDSGDACPMGLAEGGIVWHLTPADRSLDGKVALRDRPDPDEVSIMCPDDDRYSIFVATARGVDGSTDRITVESDNGQRLATFRLSLSVRIDQISLQICRRNRASHPATYCGPAQIHHAPFTTSAS